MQPRLIKATTATSAELLANRPYATPEAFLLAWVAWEGLKTRMLVIALHAHGWAVQDIYGALDKDRIHSQEHVRALYRASFGRLPANLPGLGHHWSRIESYRPTRNAYVHGSRSTSPTKLNLATTTILDLLVDPARHVARTPIELDGRVTPLGNPYGRLAPRRSRARSASSLTRMIRAITTTKGAVAR